jgi:hypothetical protein
MTQETKNSEFVRYEPALHKNVPMGARVVVPSYAGGGTGTVVGISSVHILFSYIVLLDVPIDSPYGITSAVCVGGPELNDVDGTHWRLNS